MKFRIVSVFVSLFLAFNSQAISAEPKALLSDCVEGGEQNICLLELAKQFADEINDGDEKTSILGGISSAARDVGQNAYGAEVLVIAEQLVSSLEGMDRGYPAAGVAAQIALQGDSDHALEVLIDGIIATGNNMFSPDLIYSFLLGVVDKDPKMAWTLLKRLSPPSPDDTQAAALLVMESEEGATPFYRGRTYLDTLGAIANVAFATGNESLRDEVVKEMRQYLTAIENTTYMFASEKADFAYALASAGLEDQAIKELEGIGAEGNFARTGIVKSLVSHDREDDADLVIKTIDDPYYRAFALADYSIALFAKGDDATESLNVALEAAYSLGGDLDGQVLVVSSLIMGISRTGNFQPALELLPKLEALVDEANLKGVELRRYMPVDRARRSIASAAAQAGEQEVAMQQLENISDVFSASTARGIAEGLLKHDRSNMELAIELLSRSPGPGGLAQAAIFLLEQDE